MLVQGLGRFGKVLFVMGVFAGGLLLFAFAAEMWWRYAAGEDINPGYNVDFSYSSHDDPSSKVFLAGAAIGNITPAVPDSFADNNSDGRFSIGVDTWVDRNRNRRFDAIWLAGRNHARPAGFVHDSLYAHAVVFGYQRCRIAVCVIDVYGIFYDDIVAIRARVARLLAGSQDSLQYVAVVATGTTGAPDLLGVWGRTPEESGRDPLYADRLCQVVSETVARASRSAEPASVDSAGRASLAFVRFTNGTPIALLRSNNTPSDAAGGANVAISAGHVGAAAREYPNLPQLPCLYLGDLSVRDGFETGGLFRANRLPSQATRPSMSVHAKTVLVPVGASTMRTAANLGVVDRGFPERNVRTEVAVFSLGDVQYILLPGTFEPTLLKERPTNAPHLTRVVVGRANDFLGALGNPQTEDTIAPPPSLSIGRKGRTMIIYEAAALAKEH